MDTSTRISIPISINRKCVEPGDFPLWAFLSLIHTAHPKDLIPYFEGAKLLRDWLAPIQPATEITPLIYPPYMRVANCNEVMNTLGNQYNHLVQYAALQDPHVVTASFFR